MRIGVVGCCAIGGLYAAHLTQLPDLEVWAYDVSGEHVDAVNRDGLPGDRSRRSGARVHARSDPADIPPCALGIVAVRGTFTRAAVAATRSRSSRSTRGLSPEAAECGVDAPVNHAAVRLVRGLENSWSRESQG